MFAGCRCPHCPDAVLESHEVEGRKVLACPACAGAFVGAKRGLRILAVLEADVGDPVPSRLCPVCRCAMKSVVAAEVEVEVCKTHGMWCDAGELPKLVRAVATAVRKPVPTRFAAPTAPAQPEPATAPEAHHSATEPSNLEVAKEWAGAAVDAALSPVTDLPLDALSFLDGLLDWD